MYRYGPNFRAQFISITLLILFSYQAVFSHLSIWVWKCYMQVQIEEFAQTLTNDQLTHIVLPESDGIQSEIERQGMMFDVIRFIQIGNSVHYWCIQDFAENMLSFAKDSSSTVLCNAHNQWANHLKQLVKKTTQFYLPLPLSISHQLIEQRYIPTPCKNKLAEHSPSVNTPPPRFQV